MTIQHPTPFYDDSYGVNSVNNGPYGDAITQELIPYIEQKFRGIGQPWARVLTGCSTGGWEALGMQIMYPDFYNGTWAGAPSPIDFRAWRLVNIYEDENAYWYKGAWGLVPRPGIGSRGPNEVLPANRMEDDHVGLTMEQDNLYELAIGDHGRGAGLWDGMQAVFGPIGADGYPGMIWDKRTGAINRDVAQYLARPCRSGVHPQTRLGDARTEAGRQDSPDRGHVGSMVPLWGRALRRRLSQDGERSGVRRHGRLRRPLHPLLSGRPEHSVVGVRPNGFLAADAGNGRVDAEDGAGRGRRHELAVLAVVAKPDRVARR